MSKITLVSLLTEAQSKDTKMAEVAIEVSPDELVFNSYQTKNFHMCKKAHRLFKNLQLQDDKEVLSQLTRIVKDVDKFFALEQKTLDIIKDSRTKFTTAAMNKLRRSIEQFMKEALNIQFNIGTIQTLVKRDMSAGNFVSDHINMILEECLSTY